MANGILTPFTKEDAIGAFGLGLLNMSQNRQVDPADNLLLWSMYNNRPTNDENAYPAPKFEGINPSYQLPNNPTDETLSRLMRSIGKLESGNNYASVGTRTKTGDRAYGQYQVMGSNIPIWTKEVLGRSLSPEEFLNNPEAQDAVARAKLGRYLKQYGNINDAASLWFSGRPYQGNTRKDILGTSVPEYVKTVNRYY